MDVSENAEVRRENLRRGTRRERKMEKLSREERNRSGSCSIEEKVTRRKKQRQRFARVELPTPPPDPQVEMFAERVVSYDNSASKATANALGVEDAFDHLDKLHSMMEEILEIRERNAKLFRRVRDLERVRVTRKAHQGAERLVSTGQDIVLPDEDVGFAESLLGAMLSSSFELSTSGNRVGRVAVGSNRVARGRSIGMEHRRVSCPVTTIDARQRIRSGPRSLEIMKKRPSLAVGTPKVSKWTRVKAAFKWERAACTSNDVPMEPEVAVRYLKIPENAGGSSEVSGPPTPAGTISSSSSIDDVFYRPQRTSSNQSTRITRRDESSDPSRRSRSLDGDASVPMNFVYSSRPRSKDNSCLHGKSVDPRIHKTPWGKVKDMMQLRRESIGRLPLRSISRNDDAHSTSSLESSDIHRSEQQVDGRPPRVRVSGESSASIGANISKSGSSPISNDFVDLASRRLTPTLTITVPSSEELRSISSPESVTPSPPSPRQSFESGKSERYSQPGYDTPRETRTGQVSPVSPTSGILRYGLGRSKTCQGVPFAGDYKRQQSLKGESLGSSPKMQRRDSKWNKVKRAFLTSATSVPTSPNRISSYFFDDGDATVGSYSASASAEDLENDSATSPGVQAEIQRNYRLLHDKLGTEFYRKLAEWERLKSANNSSIVRGDPTRPNPRESENLRLLGEERLTPEFKKKLEEWKRMNKAGAGEARVSNSGESRSVNRRRITDWQLWRSPSKPENKTDGPRLTEDFIKKMEEWKRIKSTTRRRETEVNAERQPREQRVAEGEEDNGGDEEEEEEEEEVEAQEEEEERQRTMETRLSEKRRRAWKSLEDEEFRSLERVLEAMEMDRQTRLSKLQRIVGSQPRRTQEVLIHTSTGLYRFEGISRKFTRKLYEWEKSQGISPELSTFRLLDPLRHGVGSLRTRAIAVDPTDDGTPRRSRHRSKSVGCVDIDSWRTKRDNEKTTVRRPCSLSLNDIDNIDPRSCIIASSIPTIPDEEDTSEDIAMEDSEAEPEAVIVDIEDVIEETASPLRKYQPHQTPVYSVAGSETTSIAIPLGTVTARHEPSPVILIEPGESHPLRARASLIKEITSEKFFHPQHESGKVVESMVNVAIPSTSTEGQRRHQRSIAAGGLGGTKREAFYAGDDELPREGSEKNKDESRLIRIADGTGAIVDSDENWQMAPTTRVNPRNFVPRQRPPNDEDESYEDSVITVRSDVRHAKKLLKTRRLTDTQVGYDWRSVDQPKMCNVRANDRGEAEEEEEEEKEKEKEEKEKEAMTDSMMEINDDEFQDNPNVERIIINEDTINKIVVPTASSSSALSASLKLSEDETSGPSSSSVEDSSRKEKREATSVFVKTKRIVFSPFRREAKNKAIDDSPEAANSDKTNETTSANKIDEPTKPDPNTSRVASASIFEESNENDQIAASLETNRVFESMKRPPLPRSPILARKEYRVSSSSSREKSPSIRMMIRRYNEKLENESCERGTACFSPIGTTTSSATSSCSGSSSPSWRTPLTERKFTKNPPDRYDEAKKTVSSRGIYGDSCGEFCNHPAAILSKSSSVDFSQRRWNLETRRESSTMEPEFLATGSSSFPTDWGKFRAERSTDLAVASTIRAMKIRRAKENFLSMGKFEDGAEEQENEEKRKNDTDCQQSESSKYLSRENTRRRNEETNRSIARLDIVKSASAGMINVDENTYERLQAAEKVNDAQLPCNSLPSTNEHLRSNMDVKKETTSRLSQIANKFKRARFRRSRDRDNSGMSTVLKLCRQSLLVDIASKNSTRSNQGEQSSKIRAESTRERSGDDDNDDNDNDDDDDDDDDGRRNDDRAKDSKF